MSKIIVFAIGALFAATPVTAMSDEERLINAILAPLAKERCAKLGTPNIGRTADEVRATCWGEPYRVNQTLTATGQYEEWSYGNRYVYLTNGVVTAIQPVRW